MLDIKSHPIADRFPSMSAAHFAALVADIKANGLREPIVMFDGQILDGRHRFRACQKLNITPSFELFDGDAHAARRLADSLNIHRRHLNGEQHRQLIMDELKRDPSQSDRSIAKKAKVSHVTVARARAGAESTGQIDQLTTRVGEDDKTRKLPTARARGLRAGFKTKAERLVAIRELVPLGHDAEQIAASIGIGVAYVKKLLSEQNIKIAIPRAGKHGRHLSPIRIVTETIGMLNGVVPGLEMLRRAGLSIDQTQATSLLLDLREAMKSIKWMEQRLREIANG